MKKILLLLLFVFGFSNAQIVNIPDVNFKTILVISTPTNGTAKNSLGQFFKVDANNDGEIQVSEALEVRELYVHQTSIANLTGINSFINLTLLKCSNNLLTSLDISQLIMLTKLICPSNQIGSINLTQNINLTSIDISNNLLTTLNVSNCLGLTELICNSNTIASINVTQNLNLQKLYCGINAFTTINVSQNVNLLELSCTDLNSIDVTQNINLKKLELAYCSLNSINVSQNLLLETFNCFENNNIVALNVTQNANLKYFICADNSLTSLDITNNPLLTQLHCYGNSLSTINVQQNPLLASFYCYDNLLTTLNVTQNPNLLLLRCNNNLLTTLNVSVNIKLVELRCNNNQLSTLYIKNGKNETLTILPNPNLTYICADESQIATIQSVVPSSTLVSSYCSFVPGGNYGIVSGIVRFDQNANGCDSSDPLLPNSIRLNITNGTISSGIFPNTNGSYELFTGSGNFQLTSVLENPSWFTVSPSSTVNLAMTLTSFVTQNFCISANGIHPDVEVVIMPILPARPGFNATYKLIYKNKGNQTLSGSINFQFDDSVLDYVSATIVPNTMSTGNLNWNYNNLLPFESRSFVITLNVNSPTETPAINIGDLLNYQVTINPLVNDEMPLDNIFSLNQIVVGSFDPNDKTCLEGNVVSPTKIGDYLHYNINFENTGTAAATFVVVKDEIDTTKFDINSLQILNASHPMTTRITGNKVEFIFDNINLGASQHGNVAFKIKTKSTLVTGNTVTNKADIYFDYNFPIITNIASTTFQILNNPDFELDNSVAISPNPANSIINIKCNSTIKSMQLFDIQGRILTTKLVDEDQSNFDISTYSNGIYFVKVTTENGIKIEKVIKE